MARKTTRKMPPRSDKISYAELAKYASEVREENTKLKISAALHKNDLASRDASIAELHHQLAVSERERTLAEERLGDYLSAVQVQARLLGEAAAASERLRYPEPKR